jgi:hypothetical protein
VDGVSIGSTSNTLLGGFLYFQDMYDGRIPAVLYKSHNPYYALSHFLALWLGGEDAFWAVTGIIPTLSAIILGLAMAVIVWGGISGFSCKARWARVEGAPLVGAVAAFSITFSSEPIWSLSWNSFDGSYSIILMSTAIAVAFVAGERLLMRGLSVLLLLLSALICARFGLVMVVSLMVIRLFSIARHCSEVAFPGSAFFSWPVIVLSTLASLTHFAQVALATQLLGLKFFGSEPLQRMGLSARWEHLGQGPLNYLNPLDAFTFLWRQSEVVIGKLPVWISIHHFMIWSIAIVAFALVAADKRFFLARPCLELLLFLPLTWTILLNESAAEHPDLIAILWLPSYALGLSFLMTMLFALMSRRINKLHNYLYMLGILWLFFLWQIQYLLRSYPLH